MTQRVIRLVLMGGLTGVKPPARPEMAARLGNAAQATKQAAVWLGVKLVLVRIQRSHQLTPEWTVTTATMASAADGARTSSATTLRCTGGLADGGVGYVGTC